MAYMMWYSAMYTNKTLLFPRTLDNQPEIHSISAVYGQLT